MQRYFIELTKQQIEEAPAFSITGEDVHHIVNVMRMNEGDQIICCSQDGFEAKCELQSVSKDKVSCLVIEWTNENRELPIKVYIASGLPKGDKLEWIIQKGTELGAHAFIPFKPRVLLSSWMTKRQRKSGKDGRKLRRKRLNNRTVTKCRE